MRGVRGIGDEAGGVMLSIVEFVTVTPGRLGLGADHISALSRSINLATPAMTPPYSLTRYSTCSAARWVKALFLMMSCLINLLTYAAMLKSSLFAESTR